MIDLMKLARGQSCRIRIPGFCTGGGADTVACHFRSLRLGAGAGLKNHPLFCAWGCSRCHNLCDSREHTDMFTRDEIRHMHALGVFETQLYLLREGYIKL